MRNSYLMCFGKPEGKRPLGHVHVDLFKLHRFCGVEKGGKTLLNFEYVRTSHVTSYDGQP